MSHIAIDARIINSSTGTYIERLLYYLQKIDHINHYSILVREKDKNYWMPINKNFQVIVADFRNYSLAEQFCFNKFLNELKPDLVHFCMPQQPILYHGLHVTTVHDLNLLKTYNSDKNWLIYHCKQLVGRYVFKRIAHTNQHLITPSQFTKNEYIKYTHINPLKVSVIYESADINIGKIVPYKHPFKEFILYVGQQSDYKNIRRLGEAHQALLNKYPDLGLVLVGRMNQAAKNNKEYFESKSYKNILFTGFLPDTQRDWLYKNTIAYIFPSLMEGFGLPGLEAMGYGAPVISSNATCLPEIYSKAAYYFNPLDIREISKSIDEVISSPKLRQRLIQLGYKQLKKYSWEETARQHLKIYLTTLKGSQK